MDTFQNTNLLFKSYVVGEAIVCLKLEVKNRDYYSSTFFTRHRHTFFGLRNTRKGKGATRP